jgi:hypothetical protein
MDKPGNPVELIGAFPGGWLAEAALWRKEPGKSCLQHALVGAVSVADGIDELIGPAQHLLPPRFRGAVEGFVHLLRVLAQRYADGVVLDQLDS